MDNATRARRSSGSRRRSFLFARSPTRSNARRESRSRSRSRSSHSRTVSNSSNSAHINGGNASELFAGGSVVEAIDNFLLAKSGAAGEVQPSHSGTAADSGTGTGAPGRANNSVAGSVEVPLSFLEFLRHQVQQLEQRSMVAEASAEAAQAAAAAALTKGDNDAVAEDDTILDATIQDSDVRSTLRQTFSSRSPAVSQHDKARRRTSAESLHLVRQVLKQQRLANKPQEVGEFVMLLWHLCRRKHVLETNMDEQVHARLREAYMSIGTWGVDVLGLRRLLSGVRGAELVFVVLAGIHKLKLGPMLVCFEGGDAMWNMFGRLGNYVWSIADSYRDNPYHNVAHAADVTQTCLAFLAPETGGLAHVLSPEQQVAFLIAACMHDAGHVGLSNNFLIATEHPLAVRYNDFSPLEQLHCATGFETLAESGCNFLGIFRARRKDEYTKMRHLIIQLVLGTDMKHHFKHVASLKKVMENATTRHISARDNLDLGGIGIGEAGGRGQSDLAKSTDDAPPVTFSEVTTTDEDLLLVLKECIHAADISNPAKPWRVCKFWTDSVLEEFYAQGDKERRLGIPISHGMDRLNPIPLPKFQMGFIQALVLPLYELLHRIKELDLSSALHCLQQNLIEWQRIQDAPVRAARKSIARSPSLRLAAENTDVERRIRDQASRAFSKLHLAHAKHAASRMLRLTRGANRWVRAAAAATAGPKTDKRATDPSSKDMSMRKRSLIRGWTHSATGPSPSTSDSPSRGGDAHVTTSTSRRLSRATDARKRSTSGISTPRMRRNLTPVRPNPNAKRFSVARSRSSNVNTRLEAFPSYSDNEEP